MAKIWYTLDKFWKITTQNHIEFKRNFMSTTIRKLAQGDDLNIVSSLIYETDKYILPSLFEDDKARAMRVLPYMIKSNTPYNENNIYVGLVDDRIVGIVIACRSPITVDVGAFFNAFESAGEMVDETLERALKEYFFPLESEGNGYYVSSICIDEACRGQGIGRELLDGVLPYLDKDLDVYLDCAEDNEIALSMYSARGFERLFAFKSFTGVPYCKLIRRANRETIIQEMKNEEEVQ